MGHPDAFEPPLLAPVEEQWKQKELDDVVRLIRRALAPRVTFANDLDRMREEAEQNAHSDLKTALGIFKRSHGWNERELRTRPE